MAADNYYDLYPLTREVARMADSEGPWEVELLKQFCNTDLSLDGLGYARNSVLASSWYVASRVTLANSDVCLCGEGRVGESLVRQWVEFYLSRVRTESQWDALSRERLASALEDLNCHLATRIFLTGYKLSLADILFYYGIHRYMAGLTFAQKAQCVHTCRWFDQVQHFPGLRPFSLPVVVFHKTPDMLQTQPTE